MSVRLGNPRVGHRVGSFYVSGPVTGRNAGRQFRVGHRLPGGFYCSTTVHRTTSRRQQRPVGALPWYALAIASLIYVGAAGALHWAGLWFLSVLLLVAVVLCWLRWAANPHQRRHC